ncbi:putative spermidine/putrescine transport system ATP-binding protein [Rhodoligotrophos appendicifer]|uniref:ABC transporter ATP-binding protein n=1 Tax=Rhodoligotrophos appendicifer TaxID=987056 RepID=UPI0011857DF3|nr:ABC transporter ATP-binding protein [Rhodoligotrophos appendicifer]
MAQRISIRDVRKTYGAVTALNSANIEVAAGEFMSLLGPSGSGKTTLLMIIAGFTQPDHGSIRFDDEEIIVMPPHKRDIGLVFQNYALFPHMTVAENVAFSLKYRPIPKGEYRKKVAAALEMVQLAGYDDRRIDALSGGQKQRVALARALVFNPKILLMDEPLSALDKNLRESMQIELRSLQKHLGTTTIYVTHDQHEAMTISDRVAIMNEGSIQQMGTPREIYESPCNRFVAGFMGDSQFIAVDRVEGMSAKIGDRHIRLRQAPDLRGGQGALLWRPEKLELLKDGGPSDMNVLPAKVRDIIYQGDSVLIQARLATGDDVLVRLPTNESTRRAMPSSGDEIWLGVHPADTIVVAL